MVIDSMESEKMGHKINWIALLILIAFLVACAPAETVPELPAPAPEMKISPTETSTLVDEVKLSTPTLTSTVAAEPTRPTATATPLPTLQLLSTSPAEPTPAQEVEPMSENPTAPPPNDPNIQELIDKAKKDLAQRTGIAIEEIVLVEFRLVTWPNASLGCPQPGMEYAQVLQDGYLIMLRAGLGIYNYHGGGYPDRGPFLCEGIGSKIIVPPPIREGDT